MSIQAAFTSKAVTRIFQRDIASYECLLSQYLSRRQTRQQIKIFIHKEQIAKEKKISKTI